MSRGKDFAKNLVAVLAALSSVVTLWSFSGCNWISWIVISILSILYAYFMSRRKNRINIVLKNQTNVVVEKGDLFKQRGFVVIPVNDFFDTHVGDGVVSPNSVHGQFISNVFRNRTIELRERIMNELEQIAPTEEVERRIADTNRKRYPLGTCVNINDGGCTYVLFALSTFDRYDKASVEPSEIHDIVVSLMTHLSNTAEDNPIYMPVFGTGLSRLGKAPQRMLLYTLETIDFIETAPMLGGIHVECYKRDMVHYNLNAIENYYKNCV